MDKADDILFKCIKKYELITKNNYIYDLENGIIVKIILKKVILLI